MTDCISKNVFINDSIVTIEEAQKALIHGAKVIYEVIRIIDGCPLFIDDHIERLEKSALLLNVSLHFSRNHIKNTIIVFIERENIYNGNLKLQLINDISDSLLILYQTKHSYPSPEMYKNGIITKTLKIERDNPNAKNIQPFHIISQLFIGKEDIYEAILVDKEDNITEGSKSNVFFIKDQDVYTALPSDVLCGITRKYVIEACRLLGLNLFERKISHSELQNFNSAFISGTSPKILPLKTIDDITYDTDTIILSNLITKLDEIIEQNISVQIKKIKPM